MTDERLSAVSVAERIGVHKQTWWAWVKRDRAPQPDEYDALSGMAVWHASTVDEFNRDRAAWRAARRAELVGSGAK